MEATPRTGTDVLSANFAAFEVDDEVLGNLREYAFTNSLYWVRCTAMYLFGISG